MRIAQQETSIEAFHAHHASGKAHGQCLRILKHIKEWGGDWSIGEIAAALNMEKSTVSSRVFELLHKFGDVVPAPFRKYRVSGIKVRPVKLAPVQKEML